MNLTTRPRFCCAAIFVAVGLCTAATAQMTSFTKNQVADRIRKVEDGVDEFQKYLNNRADDANNKAESAQDSGATTRRQSANSANTDGGGPKRGKQRMISKTPWTI